MRAVVRRPGAGPLVAQKLTGLTVRHPLTVFLVLVFGIGWPVLAVPVLAQRGRIPGAELPVEFFALAVTWFVLLPAALGITAVCAGRGAARALVSRAFRWRFGLWWLVVLFALPAVTLSIGLALGGTPAAGDVMSVVLRGAASLLTAVTLIHLCEEMVWAGFFQERLEHRHSLVVAALITAVPFAAIHVPLLLIGEPATREVAVGVIKLLTLGLAMRLMVGVFLRATGSVLAVGVLHGVYNASNNSGGLVDGLLDGADQNLAAPIALVVVTVAVTIYLRERGSAASRRGRHDAELLSSHLRGGSR